MQPKEDAWWGPEPSRSGHDPKTKTGLTALLMPLGVMGSSDITGETTKHACGFEMKQWLEVGRRHGASHVRVALFLCVGYLMSMDS